MAQMLGDNLLPESVTSRRRKVRERVRDLRQPIKERRQSVSSKVPGPNVIDKAEESLTSLRNSFVTRDTMLSRISDRRDGGSDSGSDGSSNGDGSNSGQTMQMT